ncbi:DUF1934 domain-containing protein [Acutalibacter caecimuris]|uniref:DUF1934 domain-containing protein n=1 Tax=Acutalibacter caecimuris TaxID=3093657 RepID=UPI002AC9D283|nr:DUF1934 domain-containing protein [Acutalibacter sp. M00118]
MLKEDYTINIRGKQVYEDDSGEVALSTTGTFSEKDGVQFIAYKEYDEEDPRLSHTAVLRVEPGKVTMIRAGSSTRLILEEGRRHLCHYDTGFGSLTVGVFTSELHTALGSGGGSLEIKYTLDIDSNLSSQNELRVEVIPLPAPRC